ncbi:hypothetical protein GGQ99_000228 [Aminobacter niigataensis]|uniref:Uncharacterized protein n=1 Tax=Aminobacter niigataensis TaxID=83265 RepID=A0ABR6KVF6_9HYPH|nr:hypothetical protein [Aminobacter niigataensis]
MKRKAKRWDAPLIPGSCPQAMLLCNTLRIVRS